MKKIKLKEADITKQIRGYLNIKKIPHFKHWGGPMSQKGIPDILGTLPGGRAFYIEIKTETGTIRKEQTDFLDMMRQNGALAFVARCLEDVQKNIK